jgi:hypothetical protein
MKRLLLLPLAILVGSCSSDQGVLTLTGNWGGPNAGLEATASGATFHFKCGARGEVASPLKVDAAGRFDQAGTYDPALVAGGPRPAVFRGDLRGSQLSLNVNVDQAALGPYQLVKDAPARFDVCNF